MSTNFKQVDPGAWVRPYLVAAVEWAEREDKWITSIILNTHPTTTIMSRWSVEEVMEKLND